MRAEPVGHSLPCSEECCQQEWHSLALPVCLQGRAALCLLGLCQLEIQEGAQCCAGLLCAKLVAVPSCEQKAVGSRISSLCTQMFRCLFPK